MRVSEVHYEQAQNLGNYETRRVSVTVVLAEGDDPADALATCKRLVWAELAAGVQQPRPGSLPVAAPPPVPSAPLPSGTITEKQLRAVYAIARAAAHLSEDEVDARCQELYHCRPDGLSKVEASQFIDALKGDVPL